MTHNYQPPHKVKLLGRPRSDFTLIPLDNQKEKSRFADGFFSLFRFYSTSILIVFDCHDKIKTIYKSNEKKKQVVRYVTENLYVVRARTKGTIENHLGAAHRLHIVYRLRRECPLQHQSIECLFRTRRGLCCETQMN